MALDIDVPPLDSEMPKDYDFKSRCEELESALSETRSALDEFQLSSRELEAELERELENMERQYKDAKRQKERLKMESDEWKSKFQQAKTEQTQTTNAMQKEIDALREAQKLLQQRLREMEMSNDDMEQNDRVVKSSLEDVQMKYDKAMEDVALLQAELASGETLKIENQRLKDELRDLKEEWSLLKEKANRPTNEGSPSPVRHQTPPSPPISDGSRALTPSSEAISPPKAAAGAMGLGGVGGTGTWRGVRRGMSKRLSVASDVSWASEARQTSSVKIMHDMVTRVKNLEARLQACRDLVNPLLDTSPIKDASPTKELLLSPEKSPEKDILSELPRRPMSRPQSQLSNYSERYRPTQTPRTPSSSRRLTFGRPISRQSEDIEDEGDVTITLENSANITPRRPRHKTISTSSRPESHISIRSVSHEDDNGNIFKRPESAAARRQSGLRSVSQEEDSIVFRRPESAADGNIFKRPESAADGSIFRRPESATGRRQSGIPAPSDRRTSGIPAPRRQSGIPGPRASSPTRSTSSSSFHSDTPQQSITSPSSSAGSMGAPVMFSRRQSGAQTGLPRPKSAMAGRKSMGSGIPVPR